MGSVRESRRALALWSASVVFVGLLELGGCTYTDVVATRNDMTDSNAGTGAEAGAVSTAGSSHGGGESSAGSSCDGAFCFGFEEGLGASAVVEVVERDGSLSRDCTRARTGECSAAAVLEVGGGVAYLAMNPPEGEPHWFVRAHVWIPEDLAIEDVAVIHVGTQGGNAGVNVDLRESDRVELFAIESERPLLSRAGVTRREEWTCLVLEVQASDSQGHASLRVNGELVLEDSNVDTNPEGGIEFITVGIDWSSNGQQAGTLWFDDVVVSTEQVTCD